MARLTLLPLAALLFFIIGSLCALLFQLDLETLPALLADVEIRFALGLSLLTSLISLALAALISLPAAWAMVRLRIPGKGALNLLLDLPMVTPPLVVGIGLLLLLGREGPVGQLAPMISQSLFSPLGIVIAQTYVASAIIVRSASAALASIETAYVQTAYNLGLTPLKTLLLVEVPLIWRSLLSGCVLALSRALGEFGATLMLAGATRMKTETLPIAVYLNIASGEFAPAIGCALVLIFFAFLLLLLLHLLQKAPRRESDVKC
ncbi:molybdate ABC transporter permease [Leminorella grimontii]|uniref:Molybdate ABC transporter permease n=1 Tax=Leminorella grimontii TaxID=82981 RepID=A0AAV5MZ74_9GAMM|nr:ABC transporter permease [Leminorella grimontii]KFC97488.1 permease component of an ABC superfamily molybdenum transporter [Leminorella grimontii ATCC 33999 = DSM 5078]GKX55151.1 molybdate ABC transporter permease [Leminorella grimontii]